MSNSIGCKILRIFQMFGLWYVKLHWLQNISNNSNVSSLICQTPLAAKYFKYFKCFVFDMSNSIGCLFPQGLIQELRYCLSCGWIELSPKLPNRCQIGSCSSNRIQTPQYDSTLLNQQHESPARISHTWYLSPISPSIGNVEKIQVSTHEIWNVSAFNFELFNSRCVYFVGEDPH